MTPNSPLINSSKLKQELHQVLKPFLTWMIASIACIFGVFVIWGGLAPLDSAAIAPGSVVVYSNRKTVQHLEGGIIADLLVKEGDHVETGQPLIYLNDTAARTKQELLLGQLYTAKANEARLQAERDHLENIVFPPVIKYAKNQTEIAKIIANQKQLFTTRTDSIHSEISILNQRILQFEKQIKGLQAQRKASAKQLQLIKEEEASVQTLLEDGWVEKPRLLALQRKAAELSGDKGGFESEIAKAKESITETQIQIIHTRNEYDREVLDELKETQLQLSDLEEQLQASKDVLSRTTITAPLAGTVTGLQIHTIGGVINPGEAIMDIVPENRRLIVDARVAIQDIDIVHAGLDAKVMLSAYKARFVPRVAAKVIHVSADSFINEQTQEAYFLAKVEISETAIQKLTEDVTLYPGMPAEVFIVTGSRTFLQYLLSPILDSFRRAFKE